MSGTNYGFFGSGHLFSALITSEGPLGNIGASNSVEGIRHFRKMMEKSTRHMTPADIDELIQSMEKRHE